MNNYYRNKETGNYYRVFKKTEKCFCIFKEVKNQYFDGLWEYETNEEEIGTFETEEQCFSVMI